VSDRAAPPRVEVIDDATAAMFRAMTPAQRVASALRAHRMARQFVTAIVRSGHPDWADELVNREVARRMSGGAV
jgi:hypothetical protein